jgi:hypothetical protein
MPYFSPIATLGNTETVRNNLKKHMLLLAVSCNFILSDWIEELYNAHSGSLPEELDEEFVWKEQEGDFCCMASF